MKSHSRISRLTAMTRDLIVVCMVVGGGGACTTMPGGGGAMVGTCGSGGDTLFFSDLYGGTSMVTITYPDGSSCSQTLDSGFNSVVSTDAGFVVGQTYGFSVSATGLISPPSITCTVDQAAVTDGAATVEVLLPRPNLTNQLQLRCAGNWVEG